MHRSLLSALVTGALVVGLPAQSPWYPPSASSPVSIDSGYLNNSGDQQLVVFRHAFSFAGTDWLQLHFAPTASLPEGSFLRMTAVRDGGVQRHDARTLRDWNWWSAYFNGGDLVLELIAGPKTSGNRIHVDGVTRGLSAAVPESICGSNDDRVQSNDPRQGRLWLGCTGWMINTDVMLSAGHCVGGTQIIEFNVPLSTSTGTIVRANPNDQYPFTTLGSIASGVGADWSVNRVGLNSNTGQLPTQRNGGQWYTLGTVPASPAGQNIRITGYGSTTDTNLPNNLHLVQKTHVGPLAQVNATSVCYTTDTTGGNSGSPIIHENTGNAIGIHTHGGCSTSGGCNSGTRIDRSDLQAAIRNANPNNAGFETYGAGCPTPPAFYELFDTSRPNDLGGLAFRLSPNTAGGYSVTRCTTGCFYSGYSNNLALGDDQLARNLALGFSLPLPGAGSTTAIDVDSNGWIGLIANQHAGTDYTETVAEFLANPARLAVLWDDLNPASGGAVYFDRFAGGAVVTWAGVPEFSATGSNTFQAQLFSNGDVILYYAAGNTALDGLVGYSSGAVANDPGNLDLSTAVPFSTAGGGQPVTLSADSLPVLGRVATLRLSNLPGTTISAVLNIGFLQQAIDLTSAGMPACSLLTTLDVGFGMNIAGQSATLGVPVPNIGSLAGARFFAQGAVLAPGINAVGVATSNGGRLTLGY
ncbi:MAG: trypsin-like serine protease [Planctomycetes bacterium]|nr:trypsin-like serine protease [Planctomycetota bacterium]